MHIPHLNAWKPDNWLWRTPEGRTLRGFDLKVLLTGPSQGRPGCHQGRKRAAVEGQKSA
jgi:hypothetical protein